MIRIKIDDLIREKEYKEKRRLTVATLAAETGLAPGTIQRVKAGDSTRVYLSTLDTLCNYFDLDDVRQMIEYSRDGKQEETS